LGKKTNPNNIFYNEDLTSIENNRQNMQNMQNKHNNYNINSN